jgi:hypothetical protein
MHAPINVEITVYCDNHKEYVNKTCGLNAEFSLFKGVARVDKFRHCCYSLRDMTVLFFTLKVTLISK